MSMSIAPCPSWKAVLESAIESLVDYHIFACQHCLYDPGILESSSAPGSCRCCNAKLEVFCAGFRGRLLLLLLLLLLHVKFLALDSSLYRFSSCCHGFPRLAMAVDPLEDCGVKGMDHNKELLRGPEQGSYLVNVNANIKIARLSKLIGQRDASLCLG